MIKKFDSEAADQNAANTKREIKMRPINHKEASGTSSKVLSLFKNVD